jgi:hypothetical protein
MECPGQYSQEGWSERDCQVEGRKAVLTRLGDHRRWTGRPSTTLKFGYEIECVRAEQQQQHAEELLARRSVTWLQVNLRALGTGACMHAWSRRRRDRLGGLQATPRSVGWESQAGSLGSVSYRLRGRRRRVYLLPDSRRVNVSSRVQSASRLGGPRNFSFVLW